MAGIENAHEVRDLVLDGGVDAEASEVLFDGAAAGLTGVGLGVGVTGGGICREPQVGKPAWRVIESVGALGDA